MASLARARHDSARGARVVSRHSLLYARGHDAALDRPGHVRAGSALATFGGRLAIVQDDACFLALVDVRGPLASSVRAVDDVAFPLTDGDAVVVRQFDDVRGNKKRKLDLEAAFVVPEKAGAGELLVALGSGSSALRERIVLVEDPASPSPRVSIVEAGALYAVLRGERAFSGCELNLEGAAVAGNDVVLLQRGNGAPFAEGDRTIAAVDATARISLVELVAFLREGGSPPVLREVVAWDLGRVAGQRLTFTDGVTCPSQEHGAVAFLACAEDSPDATRDGPVSGVAIGCLDDRTQSCELGLILDEHGAPLVDKAEGLAFDLEDPTRAFAVTDRDDPSAPSELLELRLGEAWSRPRSA